MKNHSSDKQTKSRDKRVLDPQNESDRKELAKISVEKTVEKYGDLLKMLGTE